ncbi:WD40/YVTN/BNR-like repeat-containing protein [Paenibacillus wynnii]|uniref:WD40/YVTN/BNR-like repeat-containing protein n=1 Tax=Paenibacillus wynnii TaxID=268407 RepID=UPI0006894463|nr:hypothetical protein [Paenibacillus wynnii]
MIELCKRTAAALLATLMLGLLAGCQPGEKPAGRGPAGSSGVAAQSPTAEPLGSSAAQTQQPQDVPAAVASPTPGDAKPGVPIRSISALRMISPSAGWIGGKGWIARTDDGGADWQVQYKGQGTIRALFALNSKLAWAEAVTEPESTPQLLRTVDGGKTWSFVGQAPNSGFLHFISKDTGFSANAMTLDGGATWSKLPIPEKLLDDAYFHDRDHGWAVTQPSSYTFNFMRAIDGGKSWSVVKRFSNTIISGAIIRSAGKDDAWIECLGDSGMSQTSYSLFHTVDGGRKWQPVIEHSTAGAGTAPGFRENTDSGVPNNSGASPGTLYVVNRKTAFMSGYCAPCEIPNTVGWTQDGGKTWTNGEQELPGFSPSQFAMADEKQGWFLSNSNDDPFVLFTTKDGGRHWERKFIFLELQPEAGHITGISVHSPTSAGAAGLITLPWKPVEHTPIVKKSDLIPSGATIIENKKFENFDGFEVTLYTQKNDKKDVYAALSTVKSQYELGVVGSYDYRKPEDIEITPTRIFGKSALKITGVAGANHAISRYFSMDDTGVPKGLLTVNTGMASEQDLDRDGYPEGVAIHGTPMNVYLYRWNKDHAEVTYINEALKAYSVNLTEDKVFEVTYQGGKQTERYSLIPEGLILWFPSAP